MKHKLTDILGMKLPADGFSPEEELLQKLIAENTVYSLYNRLPTSRMKAVVALHFELGYTQEMLAEMFGITQEAINYEIDIIKRIFLGKPHKPNKRTRKKVTPETVLEVMLLLQRQ